MEGCSLGLVLHLRGCPVTLPGCALALLLAPRAEVGLAAVYGFAGDRYDNGHWACRAVLQHQLGRGGWQRALARGIAHRTLPCGTQVELYDLRSQRHTSAVIVDRGPHGQVLPSGRWTARRQLLPGARWRGIVDLLPPVARRLGLTGLDPVIVEVLR